MWLSRVMICACACASSDGIRDVGVVDSAVVGPRLALTRAAMIGGAALLPRRDGGGRLPLVLFDSSSRSTVRRLLLLLPLPPSLRRLLVRSERGVSIACLFGETRQGMSFGRA